MFLTLRGNLKMYLFKCKHIYFVLQSIPQHTSEAMRDTGFSFCSMKDMMSTVLFVIPKAH